MNLLEQTVYRVYFDESIKVEKDLEERRNKAQYVELRGLYGFIYPYSPTQLAATLTSKRVSNRLPKAWRVIQDGDFETTVLFPDSALGTVAAMMRIHKRRKYSPDTLTKLAARAKNLNRKGLREARIDEN